MPIAGEEKGVKKETGEIIFQEVVTEVKHKIQDYTFNNNCQINLSLAIDYT